jgi:hypothetical protein
MNITQKVIDFVTETKYENLPAEVIHEAKRSLLNAVGVH